MADVVVTMSGDEQRLFKSLQRIISQEQRVEDKFKDIGKAAKGIAIADRTISSVMRYAQGFVSVNQALQIANRLLEEQKQLQEAAAAASGGLARAQAEAIKNLTGLSDAEKRFALEQAIEISRKVEFPDVAPITEAVGAGFSASGDLKKTLSAVEAAARLTRLKPEDVGAVASGALDVARGSGLTDAVRNLSFILSAGAQARIEDPRQLAETLAPVVASGVETVPDQERQEASREIAAVFATLTRAATDKLGKSSTTAATQFLSRMAEFFKEQREQGKETPTTVFGQIEALQQDAALRKEFWSKPFGEERFKGPLQQLIQDTQLSREMRQAKESITFDPQVYQEAARQVREFTDALRIATAEAGSQGSAQRMQLDPRLGYRGEVERIVAATRENVRLPWLQRMFEIPLSKIEETQRATSETPAYEAALYLQRFLPSFEEGDPAREAIQDQIDRLLEMSKNFELLPEKEVGAFTGDAVARAEAQAFYDTVRDEQLRRREAREAVAPELQDRSRSEAADKLDRAADKLDQAADKMNRNAAPAATPPRPSSRPNQLDERGGHRE